MKKILTIIIALIFTYATYGQKVYETQLPDAVIKAFKMKFTNVTNVKWEKEDTVYSAEFLMDESSTEVEYDTAGVWLNTEWEIPIDYTPKAIKSYLDSAYVGYKFKELNIIELPVDGKLYVAEMSLKKEEIDVFFTLTGVFKKAVKKSTIHNKKK